MSLLAKVHRERALWRRADKSIALFCDPRIRKNGGHDVDGEIIVLRRGRDINVYSGTLCGLVENKGSGTSLFLLPGGKVGDVRRETQIRRVNFRSSEYCHAETQKSFLPFGPSVRETEKTCAAFVFYLSVNRSNP